MGKRRWLAEGGSVLAATMGLLGAGTAPSASTASPVVGYTYLDGNTAPATQSTGPPGAQRLGHPAPRVAVAAAKVGTGTGLAPQGAIQATPGRPVPAGGDAGSNQISVLRVTRDVVATPAGLVASGGVKPVSIAVSRFRLVDVANQGDGAEAAATPAPPALRSPADRDPWLDGLRPTPRTWGCVLQRHRQPLVAPGPPPRRSTASWCCPAVIFSQRVPVHRAGPRPARGGVLAGPSLAAFVSNAHSGAGWAPCPAPATACSGCADGASPYADGQTAPCRWRSAMTAGTCSRSTPGRPITPAPAIPAAAHCS